jgi:hypothetical protein
MTVHTSTYSPPSAAASESDPADPVPDADGAAVALVLALSLLAAISGTVCALAALNLSLADYTLLRHRGEIGFIIF